MTGVELIAAAGDVVRNGCEPDEIGWLTWVITWEGARGFVAAWDAGECSGEAVAPTFELLLVAMTMVGEEDPNVELDAAGERVMEGDE